MAGIRVRNVFGDGLFAGFSDCKAVGSSFNTRDGSGGRGLAVAGGNCEVSSVKCWYTDGDAFYVTYSSAQLVNCLAQDTGRHGFYLANGVVATACQADSSGRIQTGDGFYIASSNHTISGAKASDRGQTSSSPQRYGFNFASGQRSFISGISHGNSFADINGTPGSSSCVRIITKDQGLVSHG